jgi:hypothetical protein
LKEGEDHFRLNCVSFYPRYFSCDYQCAKERACEQALPKVAVLSHQIELTTMAGSPENIPWSHLQHGKVEQMPLNYSESQAAASSTNDSYHRYRKRDYRPSQGPKGVLGGPATELSFSTEDESSYSYYSARDLSTFVREIDGRFVYMVIASPSLTPS